MHYTLKEYEEDQDAEVPIIKRFRFGFSECNTVVLNELMALLSMPIAAQGALEQIFFDNMLAPNVLLDESLFEKVTHNCTNIKMLTYGQVDDSN